MFEHDSRCAVLVFAGIVLIGAGCKGPPGAPGPPGPPGPPGAARTYYLTKTGFNGQQATTACAAGYHMASLWEVFQTAALRYDTSLGRAADDSGGGPPSNVVGWIRTGNPSSNTDNCSAWTSSAHANTGVAVALLFQEGSSQNIAPWFESAIPACDSSQAVWCVSN